MEQVERSKPGGVWHSASSTGGRVGKFIKGKNVAVSHFIIRHHTSQERGQALAIVSGVVEAGKRALPLDQGNRGR